MRRQDHGGDGTQPPASHQPCVLLEKHKGPRPGFPGYPPPSQLIPEIGELIRDFHDLAVLVEDTLILFQNTFRQKQPRLPRHPPTCCRNSSARSTSQQRVLFSSSLTYHPPICWYDPRYGASAETCTRPCVWTKNDEREH